MNIAIIGSGVYGISIANALSKNKNNKIKMWTESEESLKKLQETRDNFTPLGGIKLPSSLMFSTDYEETLKDAELVFIMCAAKFVGSVANSMKPYINKKMHFIIGSKGIEQNSCRFVHEVFSSVIETKKLGVMSGPSFAIDIANLEPIGLSLGVKSKSVFNIALKAFDKTNIKLRISHDLIGIELCGSIKNVIAVSAGILDGLGYAESTRSFLITESLHDIKGLIKGLGGNKKTILSYAGVGDLLLTCTSVKSRNYSYGLLIGQNKKKEAQEYLDNTTVEGYYTLKSIYTLLRRKKIKMPVIDLIYNIIMKEENPKKLADFLMKKQ